jgi:hypothetical protein
MMELHLLVRRLFAPLREPVATAARRATERAALAVENATSGHRREQNLARALEALDTSMFHFDVLNADDRIDARVHDYLRRTVDQIIDGLEQLTVTPVDEWLRLKLVPLEPDAEEPCKRPEQSRWQGLLARVAEAARLLLPSEPIPLRTPAVAADTGPVNGAVRLPRSVRRS